jgi:hypothetical protein
MPKTDKPTKEETGAALLAWYAKAIEKFPDGLVTQAQAATMLGISRMAVSRLVTRGHLRVVYFPEGSDDPEEPDFVGVAVGQDDPLWLKMVAWMGDCDKTYSFPKAAYVSFADVVRLWNSGKAKEKCRRDWREIVAGIKPGMRSYEELSKIQAEKKKEAAKEREEEESNK